MYSNFITPLQKLESVRFNDKIKTIYLIPISTHTETDKFISDSLTIDIFNNITGEILVDTIDEANDDLSSTSIVNYVTSYPIQIDKLRINKLDSYFETNVYEKHDFELPFIIDNTYSKITKIPS
jgi:hypothetical protein